MTLVQNFPFAAIMMCLGGGVTCAVLKPRMSRILAAALNVLIAGMMAAVLHYTAGTGESYHYLMGHFPAPWGNEIRIGPLEALMGLMFPLMTAVILAGGMNNILEDVEPGKTRLYSAMICLMTASLLALTFTNDLFTAYVFVEINTLTSCALVMLRYKSGTALSAAIRYLIMSLLGSGLFLIGVVILYNITGHLLMEPIGAAVRNLAATGEYAYPLTITLGLFSVGLALKSALWPFSSWLPDAHASATTASSGILSGLVLKGYILLLIKIIYRMLGPGLFAAEGVTSLLFLLGIGAMLAGSLFALREKDIKRMLAYSSIAQIGYIFAGIGLGTETGLVCACVQILAHAVTKPMLFCAAGNMASEAGGGHRFEHLRGMGRRNPLLGIAFAAGALSMIGIPLFAGFATKYYLCMAAIGAAGLKGILTLIAVVASTVLNALYYIPALQILFDREPDAKTPRSPGRRSVLTAAAILVFLALQFGLGIFFSRIAGIIDLGLKTLI